MVTEVSAGKTQASRIRWEVNLSGLLVKLAVKVENWERKCVGKYSVALRKWWRSFGAFLGCVPVQGGPDLSEAISERACASGWPEDAVAEFSTQSLIEKLSRSKSEGRDPEGHDKCQVMWMKNETSPLDSSSWYAIWNLYHVVYCSNCVLAIGGCVLKHKPLEACLFLLRAWQQNGVSATRQERWHKPCSRDNGSSKELNRKREVRQFKVVAKDQAKEVRQSQVSTKHPGD